MLSLGRYSTTSAGAALRGAWGGASHKRLCRPTQAHVRVGATKTRSNHAPARGRRNSTPHFKTSSSFSLARAATRATACGDLRDSVRRLARQRAAACAASRPAMTQLAPSHCSCGVTESAQDDVRRRAATVEAGDCAATPGTVRTTPLSTNHRGRVRSGRSPRALCLAQHADQASSTSHGYSWCLRRRCSASPPASAPPRGRG